MNKFDKSLFDDKPKVLAHHHVKEVENDDGSVELVVLAAEGTVLSATEQLRIALDDLERLAVSVLDREGVALVSAVTMPTNTAAGRAGMIALGVGQVRACLVSPEAIDAALQMYWLMQQFAAAAVDEWREEVRRGQGSVKAQRKAAGAGKRRQGYDMIAKYLAQKDPGKRPAKMWAELRGDPNVKPPAWNMAGKVVRISEDEMHISCSGEIPITKGVFLGTYLRPARKAASRR